MKCDKDKTLLPVFPALFSSHADVIGYDEY